MHDTIESILSASQHIRVLSPAQLAQRHKQQQPGRHAKSHHNVATGLLEVASAPDGSPIFAFVPPAVLSASGTLADDSTTSTATMSDKRGRHRRSADLATLPTLTQ